MGAEEKFCGSLGEFDTNALYLGPGEGRGGKYEKSIWHSPFCALGFYALQNLADWLALTPTGLLRKAITASQ